MMCARPESMVVCVLADERMCYGRKEEGLEGRHANSAQIAVLVVR